MAERRRVLKSGSYCSTQPQQVFGSKKTLQMLPAYICRCLAERGLVVEVVAEQLGTGDVDPKPRLTSRPSSSSTNLV